MLYDRKEEQEENPTAVIDALKAYDKNLRSLKAAKYIGNSSNSSSSSTNDELGISSDESQRTTQSSETTDAAADHSPVSNQPSSSTLRSDSTATEDVSNISSTISCFLCHTVLNFHSICFSILLLRIIACLCLTLLVVTSVITVSKCFLSVSFGRFCRKNRDFRFGLGSRDKCIVNFFMTRVIWHDFHHH